MTTPSAESVEALIKQAYPDADFIVTPEPDGLCIEIYGDSFALYWTITDEHSAILAVLEHLAGPSPDTAP